jgi:aromatic-L-amino-acid decarboxylase
MSIGDASGENGSAPQIKETHVETNERRAGPESLGDLSPETFRRCGHQIVEWLAAYLEEPETFPVLSRVGPGEIEASLPDSPPARAESFDAILRDFESTIVPGITHWNHPGFFAYFAITGSVPGVLAELLSAGLNVNAMLWRTSPAATELETVTLDWLRQVIGLPEGFEGVIYDTASISTLVAIASAREAADLDIRERGMSGRDDLPSLTLYCSEEAHSSVEKDAITLGIGRSGVRKIGTDAEYRLDPVLLKRAIDEDVVAGKRPFCVVATVGTTSTTSVDPVARIADIATRHGVWLHVDAAYAAVAAAVPEKRWIMDGVDRADSLVVNPHKWLFTPTDISAFYSRRLDVTARAFSLIPDYLRTAEEGRVRDYMNYGPQLGRRFRALKLWFVLRAYGVDGIVERLREHMRLAQLFSGWVRSSPDWEVSAPVHFSTVCFRASPRGMGDDELDALNLAVEDHVNASGEAFLSHTVLNGQVTLRLAIGNIRTQERHVRRAWELLEGALARRTA